MEGFEDLDNSLLRRLLAKKMRQGVRNIPVEKSDASICCVSYAVDDWGISAVELFGYSFLKLYLSHRSFIFGRSGWSYRLCLSTWIIYYAFRISHRPSFGPSISLSLQRTVSSLTYLTSLCQHLLLVLCLVFVCPSLYCPNWSTGVHLPRIDNTVVVFPPLFYLTNFSLHLFLVSCFSSSVLGGAAGANCPSGSQRESWLTRKWDERDLVIVWNIMSSKTFKFKTTMRWRAFGWISVTLNSVK